MRHKNYWGYLLSLVLLCGTTFNANAADFSFGSGAYIAGNNQVDVKFKNAVALGFNTESRIMIGHVADGVHLGSNKMKVRMGNVFALGFRFWGIEKKACISVATIGGHCF